MGVVFHSLSQRPKDAEADRRKAVAVYEKLDAEKYRVASLSDGLSPAYSGIGLACLAMGDAPTARVAFEKALAMDEKAAASEARNVSVQTRLARTFYNLGNTQNEPKDARKWYEKAQKLLQSLEKVETLPPPDQYAGWLKELEGAITFTRSAEKSVSGLDYALKQPADKVHIRLTVRVLSWHVEGKTKRPR